MVRDEFFSCQNKLRASGEELCAARDEVHNKTALLDGARHEASEAIGSVERLTEECHGLRGDLHRQETLVAQRDEVIASLRDEACTNGLLGGLPFRGRLLTPTQAWTSTLISLATRRRKSPFPQIVLEN